MSGLMSAATIIMGNRRRAFLSEIIPVADDHGGRNQHDQTQSHHPVSPPTDAFPLGKEYSQQRSKNDDAGHVQSPTGEIVAAHLRRAHAVKEKLEIPERSGHGAQNVIGEQR